MKSNVETGKRGQDSMDRDKLMERGRQLHSLAVFSACANLAKHLGFSKGAQKTDGLVAGLPNNAG